MLTSEVLIATISSDALKRLPQGCSSLTVEQTDLIVNKRDSGLTIFANRCQHQGGRFVADIEDNNYAVCTRHGWKFDSRTGHYVNPPPQGDKPCFVQEPYKIAYTRSGDVEVYAPQRLSLTTDSVSFKRGKLLTPMPRQLLQRGELTITYFGHACVVIKCGSFKIATDPWIIGDAFIGGWYPLHEPPIDWAQELSKVDMLYISHRHPDHYHPETLRHIYKLNPDIPIVVGELLHGAVIDSFSPFKTIQKQTLGVWREINEYLRIAILRDGALEDLDTSLLVEYKGHTIFNYVDCGDPNSGVLGKFDVVLGDFAGGASGYPMCMKGKKYTDGFLKIKKSQMNKTYLAKTMDIIKQTTPRVFVPFAGYFCEQRPEDERIRQFNHKNTPEDVVNEVQKMFGDDVRVFVPIPGLTLDLSASIPEVEYPESKYFKQYCRKEILASLKVYENDTRSFRPFQLRDDAFKFYFRWAGFCSYNLILKVQECDDSFNALGAPFVVDFRHGLDFLQHFDERNTREVYEVVYVRKSSFRYCIRYGLGWDSFFIGFNTRIERNPDVYHLPLWNHMSNKLPREPPDWKAFEELHRESIQHDRNTKRACISMSLMVFAVIISLLVSLGSS